MNTNQSKSNDIVIAWYEQYHAVLFHYALSKLHSSEIAEDCIQEVFRIATEKVAVLVNHHNIGGWLMQTLKNQVAMFFRSEISKQKLFARMIKKDDSHLTYIDNTLTDEDINNMRDCLLEDLSSKELRLYDLFYKQKLKIQVIAKLENTTEAAIKMRLMRLRNKIHDRIKNIFT